MKRTLTVFFAVLIIAGVVFAKGPAKVSVKPKYKKNKEISHKSVFKLHLKRGEEEFDQSYEWEYQLIPTDVKSGFLEKAKIKHKSFWKYINGQIPKDFNANINDTPKESDEFSIENNLIQNYLRSVPDEKTPKLFYRMMIAFTYVYLTKDKLEVGKGAEIPDEVIEGLKFTLDFKLKSKLKYKMRVKEEIDRKKPVFGIEKGCVIETSLTWRDGDEGVECRGLAIYDAKNKMIAGVKAHGWLNHKSVTKTDKSICFTFTINSFPNPPGTFKDSDSPKPATYPKAPENKTEDEGTPESELPKAFKVGEQAPDFTLEDLNGKKVSLSDFKGKVVMLHTWATTIEKIDEAMLKLYKGVYEKWSKDKFVIVGLGIGYKDDTKEKQKAYVEKNGIKWVTLWDKDRSITSKYQLKNQYYVALISAEGKAVNWGYLGDKTKDAEMGKYLQEHCSK